MAVSMTMIMCVAVPLTVIMIVCIVFSLPVLQVMVMRNIKNLIVFIGCCGVNVDWLSAPEICSIRFLVVMIMILMIITGACCI